MRIRLSLALAAVLALPALSPAWAQTPPLPDAPDKLPRASRGDRTKNLDFLFEALKAAEGFGPTRERGPAEPEWRQARG